MKTHQLTCWRRLSIPEFILLLMLCSCHTKSPTLFTLVDKTDSGLDFTNHLVASEEMNIMTYPYFYNGGGVAAGDINNDGLVDLYFTSNQGDDALYLNQDNFTFKNISITAGIRNDGEWHTGVSFVDINGDDWLDIYVCTISQISGLTGHNRLYINRGDLTFDEESASYGLNYSGLSTHSAFFDFDRDGDLDCYLLNHATHDAYSSYSLNAKYLVNDTLGDILFRNEHGYFRDASIELGIIRAYNGFGLGVAISDFNNDGWSDIYVANDFLEDDFLYLNQQGSGFLESLKDCMGHTSKFSMGVDAADINNDGYSDLITLDMKSPDEKVLKSSAGEDPPQIYAYKLGHGYHHQYARNCLQLNLGDGKFAEIGSLAGISATDWSWSALFADFDLDGLKDLFISNGIPYRPNNFDFVNFLYDKYRADMSSDERSEMWRQALNLMPDGSWHNYTFQGCRDLMFKDRSIDWGFTEKNCSNGAAYADLDNDGDLDLILNRLNDSPALYRNNAENGQYLKIRLKGKNTNTQGLGAKVFLWTGSKCQLQEVMTSRGFMSSVDPSLIFGLGQDNEKRIRDKFTIDSILIIWPNGERQIMRNIEPGQSLQIEQKGHLATAANPPGTRLVNRTSLNLDYRHEDDEESDLIRKSLQPFDLSQSGPAITSGDINGDGREDFFIGGAAKKKASIWIQDPDGQFSESVQPVLMNDQDFEDTDAVFIDIEQDGDLDLYVGSGGNQVLELLTDRLYLNDGSGHFTTGQRLLPVTRTNTACVRSADFDQDGDTDLFVGGRNLKDQYGSPAESYILINVGGRYEDHTRQICPDLEQIGMVTDACWVDFDTDGFSDLVVVGEWMAPTLFKSDGKTLKKLEADPKNIGLWQCIFPCDLDADGDLDLIIGNLGLNSILISHHEADIRLYLISREGEHEPVMAYERGGTYFPLNTRDELIKVFPEIAKKYTSYQDFGGRSIEEIFSESQIGKARILTANQLKSVYLENDRGSFLMHTLPNITQSSSLNAFCSTDLNQDGALDILAAGNRWNTSQAQGRYDACWGWVLIGNGMGEFQVMNPSESGFWVPGEVNRLLKFTSNGLDHILAARHNDSILTFSLGN